MVLVIIVRDNTCYSGELTSQYVLVRQRAQHIVHLQTFMNTLGWNIVKYLLGHVCMYLHSI